MRKNQIYFTPSDTSFSLIFLSIVANHAIGAITHATNRDHKRNFDAHSNLCVSVDQIDRNEPTIHHGIGKHVLIGRGLNDVVRDFVHRVTSYNLYVYHLIDQKKIPPVFHSK